MNRKLKHGIVIFFLIGSILGSMFFNPITNPSVKATWWNSQWDDYVHITIDNSLIETDLVNFPCLIVINSTVSAKADDGNSLRFIGLDNTTIYNHEVERPWNTTANNYVWVNLTRVTASSATHLLMYYNNSVAIDTSTSDTWDSNYVLIAHMNGTGDDQDVYESTSNHYTGNAFGTNASTGKIGTARTFTRLSNNFIDFQNASKNANLNFVDQVTVELWAKDVAWNDSSHIMRFMYWDDHWRFFKDNNDAHSQYWYTEDVTGDLACQADVSLRTNESWYYIWSTYSSVTDRAVTWENTTKLDIANTVGGTPGGSTSTHLYVGGKNTSWNVEGCIDEFRLSNIQRNTSWMNASYHFMAQTSGLVTISQNRSNPGAALNEPTGFTATTNSTSMIYLNWTNDVNATHTRIQRNTGSYPTNYLDGANVYNGTGENYENSGLTVSTVYYYRAWSFNSTASNYSSAYASASNSTGPTNPTAITSALDGANLNISWTKGARADVTKLVRKAGSYPASPDDGTSLQNATTDYYVDTLSTIYYYKLFSYDNTTDLFSSGAEVEWGVLTVNCYDEETNDALTFDLFISDQEGIDTYYQTHCSNPTLIDVNDLPLGESISIKVSANTSYGNESETFTGYGSTENQSITYIALSKEPINKAKTNVTCRNTTSGGHYYPTFTLSDDLITIMPHASGEFNKVDVNYSYKAYEDRFYNDDFEANTFYTLDAYLPPTEGTDTRLYKVTVVGRQGEFTSPPIEDARLVFKRYLPFVGAYTTISSIHTDANGQAYIYLIPEEIYKVNITKTGYVSADPEVIPVDSDNPVDRVISLRILPTPQEEVKYELFWDTITFTGKMDGAYLKNGNITITYIDSNTTTTNTTIHLYEIWNNTVTLKDSTTNISEQSFSYKVSGINTTRTHYTKLYFNNSNTFDASSPVSITIMPLYTLRGTSTSSLDDKIINVIGPFAIIIDGNILKTGWHNVIAIILPILLLAGFGVFNVGAGLFACGLSMGLIQIIYARWFTDTLNPLFILLAPVIIAIAIIYIWTKGRGDENL